MKTIQLSQYGKIRVGDILTLQGIDNSNSILKEKVTSVNNTKSDDPYFQVRTENLGYDFTNFYSIIRIN